MKRSRFKRMDTGKLVAYVVFVLLYVVLCVLKPRCFSLYYLNVKADSALALILLAIGQTMVLISKGMDLSVGGVMSVCSCIMATVSANSLTKALLLCLLVSVVTGALNAFLIAGPFKLQPFVATLGTWTILDGIALAILKTDGGTIAEQFSDFVSLSVGPVHISVVFIVVIALLWALLRNTAPVYAIYAVGSNENAAYCNGTSILRTKMLTYIFSSVCACLAGIFYAGKMGTGSPTAGDANIMLSVAASVIGGTALSGGKGGLFGTIIGVLILRMIGDLLVFAGVSSYFTTLFQGVLMIGSVALGSIGYVMKQKGENDE